ncbi:MAG: glycoside hydrolase family 32 protein [Prevotella sp.]|nr:glycoside hydrolase family 32 protein [Prevotella sp.]
MTATFVGCSKDEYEQDYNPLIDNPEPEQPNNPPKSGGQDSYNETYRPQIHYTPGQNWMNDPNGMVFSDGTYHLFYQYNPRANDWGNMSWGHATSTDLVHWTEQAVAMTRDELGDVFSGSAVIDKDNTAGFGANAMVALYTSAGTAQQQSIAYSIDGGNNFTRYSGNPVIPNNDDNLRDPKVFWHGETKQWVMTLAKGWKMGVEFYTSPDLKNWTHQSTFFKELPGRPSLQWECPDLIPFGEKWVLIVSVNPGGPILGSGTMYFVGSFDGKAFTADNLDYPLWLDYGMDNYAGVTWSNTGDRKVLIGWMNNWQYAGNVPCTPWRSAMTLPRELKLIEHDGKPLLANTVVSEIDKIAENWQAAGTGLDVKDAYQLRITLGLDQNGSITLSNSSGEKYVLDINASSRTLTTHRTSATGMASFNGSFSIPSMQAPLNVNSDNVTLDLFVDQSSVEIFTQNGSMSMTNLVFPKAIYNHLTITGTTVEAQVRRLKRIWN